MEPFSSLWSGSRKQTEFPLWIKILLQMWWTNLNCPLPVALCTQFKDLFLLCDQVTVKWCLGNNMNLPFSVVAPWVKGAMQPNMRGSQYVSIFSRQRYYQLKMGKNGVFSVKSTYNAITVNGSVFLIQTYLEKAPQNPDFLMACRE
jgi:hypothetical protein